MIMKYMLNYLKKWRWLNMIKEIKELIEESEQNLQDMIEASEVRGYDDIEHIEDKAWEEGYQAGLRSALAIVQDVGLDKWEE
jgi:hypothetical protein